MASDLLHYAGSMHHPLPNSIRDTEGDPWYRSCMLLATGACRHGDQSRHATGTTIRHPKSLLALTLAVRPSAEKKRGLPDRHPGPLGGQTPCVGGQKAPSSPRPGWTDRQRIGSLSTYVAWHAQASTWVHGGTCRSLLLHTSAHGPRVVEVIAFTLPLAVRPSLDKKRHLPP